MKAGGWGDSRQGLIGSIEVPGMGELASRGFSQQRSGFCVKIFGTPRRATPSVSGALHEEDQSREGGR
jgi:hypothetical protein